MSVGVFVRYILRQPPKAAPPRVDLKISAKFCVHHLDLGHKKGELGCEAAFTRVTLDSTTTSVIKGIEGKTVQLQSSVI